jgi:hypothetical protein
MDMYRRNLMKGVLTGGTFLALGIPPGAFASGQARRVERFGLLLGNTRADAAFAAGFRMAAQYVAGGAGEIVAVKGGSPEVVKLKRGLLNDYGLVARLLEKSRNTRWVAIMDEGSAAVFTELVRNAGGELLLLGSHASSGGASMREGAEAVSEFRHIWAAASQAQSAGSILASSLVADESSFSIVENFLSTQALPGETMTASNGVPGFAGYRLERPGAGLGSEADAFHLHCSGVSLSEGCASVGWNPAGAWRPVSQREPVHGTGAFTAPGNGQPRSEWVESVGYAVTAAALGGNSTQEPCCSRAFVHRPALGKPGRRMSVAEQFASFVIDT